METNETDTSLKQFNETIEAWIAYLDDYTFEMLCQKAQVESWSLGQVYVHIIEDTRFFVAQMKTCLLNNAYSKEEMHEDAKAMFHNKEFPDTLLAGAASNSSIRQPQSKAELRQSLVAIKDEVCRLYSTFDFSTSTGKTEHPGLRFFNALEWLQFAGMHMRHHFRQKKRIDEQLST